MSTDPSSVPVKKPALLFEDQGENLHLISDSDLEKIFIGNATARHVLELCDGSQSVADIVSALSSRYPGERPDEVGADVETFLCNAAEIGVVRWETESRSRS